MSMASFLLAAYRRSVCFSILAFFAFLAPSLALAQDFTGNGPFEISTETGLRAFAAAVNGGNNFSGKTVKLTANIVLLEDWIPIGNCTVEFYDVEGSSFKGIFDGQYHKIFNLSVKKESKYTVAGLFGCVEDAEIKNIGVVNADIEANGEEEARAGILAGNIAGTVTISNSYATGGVYGSYYGDDVSGMIWLGGLVGYAGGEFLIENSYVIANIRSHGLDPNDLNAIGGLIGATSFMGAEGKIKSSYTVGTFSNEGSYTFMGGIVGYDMDEGIVATSVYYNQSGAEEEDGGGGSIDGVTALSDTELKIKAKFAGFDFEDIWGIDATVNQGYPHLLAFPFDTDEPITCQEGELLEGENCVPNVITCPEGQHLEDGNCVSTPIRSLPQLANQISVQTTGKTIVLGNLPGNAKVEMYNLQGKRMYSANSGNSQSLKIFAQTNGVYIVKISLGSEKKTLRVSVM